jgi:mono/diheme cytochrome c family protein
MNRSGHLAGIVLAIGASVVAATAQQTANTSDPATQRTLLNTYCVGCHNEKLKTAGLMLDKADVAHPPEGAEVWEKVIRRLRAGTMPPAGMPKPSPAAVTGIVTYLETSIDQAAAAKPNPGRAIAHRLNRAEYTNAIRDLLGLEIDASQLLPSDDESYGFDNIADVLKLSPVLLERYMTAAWDLSRVAMGDPHIRASTATYIVRPDLSQGGHIPGLPLGTRGGLLVRHTFPLDGNYIFKIRLTRTTTEEIRGINDSERVEVAIDGVRVFLKPVGGKADVGEKGENQDIATAVADVVDDRLTFRVPVKAGVHGVAFAFLKTTDALDDGAQKPFERTTIHPLSIAGKQHIDRVSITGPFQGKAGGDTISRNKILLCRPAAGSEELPCARRILSALARQAFRRPVNEQDLEMLLGFYQKGRNQGSFDTGIEMALRALLANPEFVMRFEDEPASVAANSVYRVSDLDLASRLSFFLWSSIPDEQLLTLAAQGRLKDPAVLEQQVRRMLADPKSSALVTNFAGQWLYVRNLRGISPDPQEFPDFDDNLRAAYERETQLFFESIIREDHSILDLLNANYTFLNERLARQYGIPNVSGDNFQRVTLTDPARFGLLGKGSVLAVTSLATRTSPVLRGKWILTNVLGTPPPAPPPNVPPLKEPEYGEKAKLSMRERMEAHRANPVCASCHKIMDPIGFSLENFDAVGTWRESENGLKIDSSGQLADGTAVNGPVGLRRVLEAHPEQFASTATERLLTYALGRGLEYYDMPALRAITRESAKSDYLFSSIVLNIVKSVPFEMKIRQSQDGAEAAGNAAPPSVAGPVLASASANDRQAKQ